MSSVASLTAEEAATLSNYPTIPPPPGVKSNFINPKDHNVTLYVIPSLFLGIMIMFLLNRVYAKICIVRRYTWDDCRVFSLAGGDFD